MTYYCKTFQTGWHNGQRHQRTELWPRTRLQKTWQNPILDEKCPINTGARPSISSADKRNRRGAHLRFTCIKRNKSSKNRIFVNGIQQPSEFLMTLIILYLLFSRAWSTNSWISFIMNSIWRIRAKWPRYHLATRQVIAAKTRKTCRRRRKILTTRNCQWYMRKMHPCNRPVEMGIRPWLEFEFGIFSDVGLPSHASLSNSALQLYRFDR